MMDYTFIFLWLLVFCPFLSFANGDEFDNICKSQEVKHQCICKKFHQNLPNELSCIGGDAFYDAINILNQHTDLNFSTIVITGGSIGIISHTDMIKFHNVEHLYLQRNEISNIENNAFKNQQKMKFLDLSFNKLETLQENALNHLSQLQNLSLSNNNLLNIQIGAFSSLDSLFYLDLSNNNLTYIESYFLPLKFLQYLILAHNKITYITNNSFSTLIHLQVLDLSFNSLKAIPHHVFHRLTNLQFLSLAMNELQTLDEDSFKGNAILEKVNLTGNLWVCDEKLLPLNNWFKKHETYKEGAICSEPPDLRNYTLQSALDILNLELRIEESPTCNATMCNCTVQKDKLVVTVDCSNKGFTRLPEVVPYKTKAINLSNNKIKSLNIDHINATLWSEVTFLYLNNNIIDTSKGLEGNWLLRNMVALHLSNNRLTEVPIHILEQIRGGSLDELYLAGNPWTCDCNTIHFQTWLQNNYRVVRNLDGVTCSSDSGTFVNLQIHKIKKSQLCPQQVTLIHFLDVINCIMVVTILLLLVKVSYDYWLQKRTGKLPRFWSLNLGN